MILSSRSAFGQVPIFKTNEMHPVSLGMGPKNIMLNNGNLQTIACVKWVIFNFSKVGGNSNPSVGHHKLTLLLIKYFLSSRLIILHNFFQQQKKTKSTIYTHTYKKHP